MCAPGPLPLRHPPAPMCPCDPLCALESTCVRMRTQELGSRAIAQRTAGWHSCRRGAPELRALVH
eukprot:15431588-Alexandrium_andersonii.AAC.1